jgi:hypothetical protein
MSNAPYEPPKPIPAAAPASERLDYSELPPTGVRKIPTVDYEERPVQRFRWGAVIAGLFLAIASQILLGMLGIAVGLTAVNPASASPLSGVGLGAGIWTVIAALISLFVGGYAAARLGNAMNRGEGMLAGALTWATSLVLALWLVGSVAATAASMATATPSPGARTPAPAQIRPGAPRGSLESAARRGADDAAKGAWLTFGGACVSLLTALLGGAAGARSLDRHRGAGPRARMREEREEVASEMRERAG